MPMITAERVKTAMIEKGIAWAESHKCSICGSPVGWERLGENLYYQSSCDCCRWHPPEPREWVDAADHINRQTRNSEKFGDIAAQEALKFGVTLPPAEIA